MRNFYIWSENFEEAGHLRFVTNTEIKWFFKKETAKMCARRNPLVKTNFCGNNYIA